ncbi:MAG: hypothetical protein ABIR79_24230, partial [Candidatus Binatia bacterium]
DLGQEHFPAARPCRGGRPGSALRDRDAPIGRCVPVAPAAPRAVLRLRRTRGRPLRRTRFPTAAVAEAPANV